MTIEPVVRRMVIKVEVDHWEWSSTSRVKETFDLTPLVVSYQWQKSIKTPMGGCSITCLPQLIDRAIIEIVDPMDVVRVSEFGTVKFVGYVRKVSFTGTIQSDGKPSRVCIITATSMGGIFQESNLGANLFLLQKSPEFFNAAQDLATKIADKCKQDAPIGDVVKTVVDTWLTFVDTASGSTAYRNWFNNLIDYETGLAETKVPGFAREWMAFTGTEENLTLWQLLEKFGEAPFYELWFDTGPRKVVAGTSTISLQGGTAPKTCLICRPTPFNGTVDYQGVNHNYFDTLGVKTVPKSHLVKYDLNKSMEEVYTFYISHPAIWNMQDVLLVATGQAVKDDTKIAKYLYRPLTVQEFYGRIGDAEKDASVSPDNTKDLEDSLKYGATTLKNWFQYSDIMLSGAILMMVPKKPENDVWIGDKIELEGLTGHFYVESVQHSWKYQGNLTSSLNVTRGLDGVRSIVLANKMFKTMKQAK
jgi:hypothetical protein